LAKFFCFVCLPFYICRGEGDVNKSAKKERGFEHPAAMTEQSWLLKDLLYGKENLQGQSEKSGAGEPDSRLNFLSSGH